MAKQLAAFLPAPFTHARLIRCARVAGDSAKEAKGDGGGGCEDCHPRKGCYSPMACTYMGSSWLRILWCILPRDVRTLTFLPTHELVFRIKALKVGQLLAGEQSLQPIVGVLSGGRSMFCQEQTEQSDRSHIGLQAASFR